MSSFSCVSKILKVVVVVNDLTFKAPACHCLFTSGRYTTNFPLMQDESPLHSNKST